VDRGVALTVSSSSDGGATLQGGGGAQRQCLARLRDEGVCTAPGSLLPSATKFPPSVGRSEQSPHYHTALNTPLHCTQH